MAISVPKLEDLTIKLVQDLSGELVILSPVQVEESLDMLYECARKLCDVYRVEDCTELMYDMLTGLIESIMHGTESVDQVEKFRYAIGMKIYQLQGLSK